METVKKERTNKARTLTRRIKELFNALKNTASVIEVKEKISTVKYTFEELGDLQDRVLELVDETDAEAYETQVKWYDAYDDKANRGIANAREYVKNMEKDEKNAIPVKLSKLSIPIFDSDPKKYLKWKNTFERYTKTLNNDVKYDYLIASTKGKGHDLVSNKSTYWEAIESLDKEYGNIHLIMGLLIDDLKSLPVVRRGDFKAFEKLAYEANAFRDRLEEMGLEAESENTYVLKELESKLHTEDFHKWLEYMGKEVDRRKVRDFVSWLEYQRNLRRISNSPAPKSSSAGPHFTEPPLDRSRKYMSNVGQSRICGICNNEQHEVTSCPVFINWNVDDKWNFAKTNRLCFQCLQPNHRRENCAEPKCQYCGKFHHSMLHNDFKFNYQTPLSNVTGLNRDDTATWRDVKFEQPGASTPPRCFLPIVKSTVINNEIKLTVTTILDSGSELNILSSKLCEKLHLYGSVISINIVGVAGEIIRKKTRLVDLIVEDRMGYQTPIQCIVLDKTCGNALKVDPQILPYLGKNVPIPNDIYQEGGEIELLIGMTCPRLHQQISMYGDASGLMVMETRFGPSLVGRVPNNTNGNYECGVYRTFQMSLTEDDKLLKIVESEIAGIEKECACQVKTDEEILFETSMKDAWHIDSTGRFEVKLPWKIDPNNLRNNRLQAQSRSLALEKKLAKEPELLRLFEEQIEEMTSLNILRKTKPDYPRRYLPLLAVVNLEKDSTKLRVCLDSRAKFSGLSLNDALLKGKLKMNDIFETITRFRCGKYTLVGDIRKMFWQIKINAEDERYHGVIYKGETYVFTRICFGNKPSPPIADMSMLKMAQHGKESHPRASDALIFKRYMDDIVDANSDVDVLIKTRTQIDELIGKFGFEIKEWMSNNKRVGQIVKETKILGIRYNVDNDKLCAAMNVLSNIKFTKRKVLSTIAGCWDPLGMCAGVVLKGKLIFQSITRLGYNWDQIIDNSELLDNWSKWNLEIKECETVSVPRSILPSEKYMTNKLTCEIFGFSDASNTAYACVVYLRWENHDESIIDVKFLGAKAKVAAIKGNTIPRNELCGALLLTRLTSSTLESIKKTEISEHLAHSDPKLHSDSTTVLSWINSPPIKFKPYVKNKVIEIQTALAASNWKYVPSNKNKAADMLSKGCSKAGLDLIINGPDILRTPYNEWPKYPKSESNHGETATMEEAVVERNFAVIMNAEPLMNLEKYNSWKKVLRITAYVFRFINKLRKKTHSENKGDNYYGNVTHSEMDVAEKYWLRHAQKEIIYATKSVEKLVPFEDEFGIKRVTGRLEQSEIFEEDRKHPIILHSKSRVSELIIADIHKKLCHPGHNRVIAESRRKYWIINVRRLAKSVGYKCVICRRWRGKRLSQIMSDLPPSRIQQGCAPFENVSVDYFGPILLKFGRRQRIKGYGIVFVCLTTRAVHLDLATSLSTDAFLLALRRFISVYGQPRYVRSDNGSNFRGAEREITEMIKRWRENQEDSTKLRNFLSENNVKWTFSTPLAPHHNGAVECMVKSVKTALKKLTHYRILAEEEYRTFLIEVQNLINSRPVWLPNDGDLEEPPITCNDLLRPRGLNRHPHHLDEGSPRSRYEYIQRLITEWWKIWLRNFVPNLQVRDKWWKPREDIEIGDMVLLIDPATIRGRWQMGRIIGVFPGNDGKVRSVKVKTATGNYDRPITKLSLLLTKREYEADQ